MDIVKVDLSKVISIGLITEQIGLVYDIRFAYVNSINYINMGKLDLIRIANDLLPFSRCTPVSQRKYTKLNALQALYPKGLTYVKPAYDWGKCNITCSDANYKKRVYVFARVSKKYAKYLRGQKWI